MIQRLSKLIAKLIVSVYDQRDIRPTELSKIIERVGVSTTNIANWNTGKLKYIYPYMLRDMFAIRYLIITEAYFFDILIIL